MKKHLESKEQFVNWLSTMYMFYYINGLIEIDSDEKIVSKIHKMIQTKECFS
jgi:hypothetical protein